MIWLTKKIVFPPHETATKDGVLALGGDLSSERLIYAYKNGIFPWYSEGEPIVWYSPLERMVLFPKELKISKSMRQVMRKNEFSITENTAFSEVIQYIQNNPRIVKMKEKQTRNGLRLIITFENITTINKALRSLSPVLG